MIHTRLITSTIMITTNNKELQKKKLMSVITSEESSSSSNSENGYSNTSESSDNDSEQSNKAICGECGKELDTGWKCNACRRECPICNRALSNDPNEYCERCFRFCKYHGLFSKSKDGLFICTQCVSSSSCQK